MATDTTGRTTRIWGDCWPSTTCPIHDTDKSSTAWVNLVCMIHIPLDCWGSWCSSRFRLVLDHPVTCHGSEPQRDSTHLTWQSPSKQRLKPVIRMYRRTQKEGDLEGNHWKNCWMRTETVLTVKVQSQRRWRTDGVASSRFRALMKRPLYHEQHHHPVTILSCYKVSTTT